MKVRIHCLLYLNLVFFSNYAIFLKLCHQMRFEVNCAKLQHCVISDGLSLSLLLLLLLLLLFIIIIITQHQNKLHNKRPDKSIYAK